MPLRNLKIGFLAALLLSGVSCSQPVVQRDESLRPVIPAPSGRAEDRRVLVGEWEYEDGAVVTLTLDEEGNGSYPWEEGRFETRSLSDHTWQGMWFQTENDREGGFRVEFSRDFSEGEGRWWYTRIGTDHAPTNKGGNFHLTRKSSQTNPTVSSLAP